MRDDDADDLNPWELALQYIQPRLDTAEFRRWFGESAYASDSGDQITVWVATESVRRYIEQHYHEEIDTALRSIGRSDTLVRFVVTGVGEDEDDEERDGG